MMYLQHFGLKHDPLGARSQLFDTEQYKALEKQLTWLLECRGIALITGTAGIGKTRAIEHWSNKQNRSMYEVIYQPDNHFRPFDIYAQLADALGLDYKYRYYQLWHVLKAELLSRYKDKKESVIWILDEAHLLPVQFLADLPSFMNYSFDSKTIMTIILIANPQIEKILKKRLYEPLISRLNFHCQWHGLEKYEHFETFVNKAFEEAGMQKSIIAGGAMQTLHLASQGGLRYANRIITRSLQIAQSENAAFLSAEIIEAACSQLTIGGKKLL